MSASTVTREGARAGIAGALVVAVWFFFVDLISGQALSTPATLGAALVSVLRGNQHLGFITHVAVYTVFHFAAFIIVGIVAAALLRASDAEPSLMAGLFVLFVVIEVGFVGFTYLLSQGSSLGRIAWYQAGAANLLSAMVMGRILVRQHPQALENMAGALRGM
ncbi:MAG: hypothetical protein U0132_23450 [Gemmatimonadaceae bacterium]